jgi:hypothetical protein
VGITRLNPHTCPVPHHTNIYILKNPVLLKKVRNKIKYSR